MEEKNFQSLESTGAQIQELVVDNENISVFLRQVFSFMSLALVISGALAWVFGTNEALFSLLRNPAGGATTLGYIVMFAPLGLIFLMGGAIEKMNSTALTIAFIGFSAIMGISFSYIFVIYSLGSIVNVFFLTGGVFAIMAIAGYTTKADLSKLGTILFIGLIGIIIASIVNIFFLKSGIMSLIISCLGVVIFTGLTAYDMQRLKHLGSYVENGTEGATKMAIMGSLSLYLNFINLFLILLRFFGNRD